MPRRAAYFDALNVNLKKAGLYQPALILDLDRLDKNIATLQSHLPGGMGYRVVAKSLPVPKLLTHISQTMCTHKFMTFNAPMLMAITEAMPQADQLLGKPLPVAALRDFLRQTDKAASERIHWLIDTPERLAAYGQASDHFGVSLNVVLELDVGLHRGGFEADDHLKAALTQISESPSLSFRGFMGYEPHLASVPKAFGWQARAIKKSWERYQTALAIAEEIYEPAVMDNIIRNVAGSPTYRLYKDTLIGNEVSLGSALVKPTDFDTELLEPFLPACFIAAPVLKAPGMTRIPALEFADGLKRLISPKSAQTFFIHGGKWMADPVDPPHMRYNNTFGRSSNQEMINGPAETRLIPDDFVFFRPHQSEAVLFQFGDLWVVRGGEFIERWPVFDISA